MWKEIPKFNNYEANKSGLIRNRLTKKVLHTFPNKDNYLRVQIINNWGVAKNRYVHRLIAKTFIPNPFKLKDVNHKNNNRQDNRVANLEWLSRSDNIKQVWRTGARRKARRKNHGRNNKP